MPSFFRPAGWSLVGLCTVTVALLLWLPYRFPVAPSFSDSYLFGFNNHAAQVLILAFVAAVLGCTFHWTWPQAANCPADRLSRKSLYWALTLTLGTSAALAIATHKLEGIEESIYLIDRVKLVLAGKPPGVDFEFAYGAFLLYGPAWLAHAFHLSASGAYFLFWTLTNLVGVLLLYCTLQWVDVPFRLRRAAFAFFFAFALTAMLCTGTNYSLFRFTTPLFLGLCLYRFQSRTASPWSIPAGILLIVPCYAALLTISPELALAFACGMCLYVLLFLDLRARRTFLSFLILLPALLLVTRVAAHFEVFATLDAFRTGGFNFPIPPAPHILLFLTTLGLVSSYCLQQFRLRRPNAVVVLTLVSAGSIAGALGRCDLIHVLLDPLGCWIAAFVLVGRFRVFGRFFVSAACFLFLLLNARFSLYGRAIGWSKAALPAIFANEPEHSDNRLDRFIQAKSATLFGVEKAKTKLAEMRFFAHHQRGISPALLYGYPSGTIFEAPFSYTPSRFGTLQTKEIDPGFYFGMVNVLTPQAVQRKVAELAHSPERPLLILAGNEDSCSPDPEGRRSTISSYFWYPYHAAVRNPGSVLEPVCSYIHTHYRVAIAASPENFGYALWQRLPAGTEASSIPDPLQH